MKQMFKLIAVALAASLLLFGCGGAGGNATAGSTPAAASTEAASGAATQAASQAAASSGSQDTVENSQAGSAAMEEAADMDNTAIDAASLSLNENIHVNQIGYRPKDIKQVILNGKAGRFAIFDKASGTQVYMGKMEKGKQDAASGDDLCFGDFTGFEDPGTYFAAVPGYGITGEFKIADNVYQGLKDSLLKAFYFQRCGMELEEKYAGVWNHPACHITKGTVFGQEGTELDGNGGWHDAGDYGKYTVPGATAAADLMMAWEFFPDSFANKIIIPESGNKTPDILDEVRYELQWLLKMQDGKTGGVYHKLTSKAFPPLSMMPQDDLGKLYFSPVSSTATGDFAAVAAMASRVFSAYDAKFAGTCLKASEKAWKWLEQNKNVQGFKNPGDISTGEYGDDRDADERLWAAAELYRSTGSAAYGDYIKSVFKDTGTGGFAFGWQNMGGYAGTAYMNTEKDKQDPAVYEYFKNELLGAADSKLSKAGSSGYHITLGAGDFYWGSNMTLLNDARVLILADGLDPAKGYGKTAGSNMDYLLGNNPLNQCYVTGFGTKPVMDPHHRPSKADNAEQPVPGLVAGGPNSGLNDEFAKINLKGKPPARCYIDFSGSYSTNEIAIYWNSPAVFVAAYLSGK